MNIAKELDNETSYTYFGARYYDSELSSWLSVDPMASSRSWVSPYSYCQNYPIGRIDPTGVLDGDFYDQKGKYLGTDGIDDRKVYVVTNKNEAKAIKKTDKSGGTTNSSDVSSTVTFYSGTFHSHPSGSVSISHPSEIGMETFGGTTKTYSFIQTPSDRDIQAAAEISYMTGNHYVLGTGNNTVYIYNGNGILATFPLDKFGNVGK